MSLPALPAAAFEEAVTAAGLVPLAATVAEQFSRFADLLLRWNAKFNLTAIRTPEEMLRRHFLESIFCAQSLPAGVRTLLDYGSGAGFPGIPIALCRPEIRVTLAESQSKKTAFLREALRMLDLSAEVSDGRVELMAPKRVFDVVTLRAVDRMQEAAELGARRVAEGGVLVLMTTKASMPTLPGFATTTVLPIPLSDCGVLALFRV